MSGQHRFVVRGIRIVSAVILSCGGIVQAVPRQVPSDYATVQAAIDAAGDGDEIILQAGTYVGPGNRDLDFRGKAVLVRSVDPQDPTVVAATVLDCQGSSAAPCRAATLNCGSAAWEAGLAGLTITGAWDEDGAIVCEAYSAPVIRNCRIRGNTASGIYCSLGAVPRIRDCRIEDNITGAEGGGICLSKECRPLIERCLIRGNSAAAGGGVYCYQGWPDILDSRISDNCADTGGGVCWEDSAVLLENCTLAGNSGRTGGGAHGLSMIYRDRSSIANCIIWDNASDDGRQVALAVSPYAQAADALAVSYSLIQGGPPDVCDPAGWTLAWGDGNLPGEADPCFVAAEGAALPCGDSADTGYRLAADSPCIDAADPSQDYAGRRDLAGGPRVIGARADLGSYEAVEATSRQTLIGDINGDGRVDAADLLPLANAFGWSTGQPGFDPACDLDGNGTVDMADLLLLAADFGN